MPPASNPFSLTGRRALVTGSSQGIGFALARGLAVAGAHVILNGRAAAKLDRAAAELRAAGLNVAASAFDVTDEAAVNAAARLLGSIDILVNNAGIQRRAPLAEMSLADWETVLRHNLTSAFLVARAVAPGMVAQKRGKIVNVCSVMAQLVRPTVGNYAAAKAGLLQLTRAMALEWAPHNIQANAIAPGYMLTPLNESLVANPQFDAWIRGRTPAGRWGQPDELVGATLLFASPASDFITGQILYIDGGLTIAI